jgi:gamma-glutamyl-gamma-aminobutyrate hydrolase PuuD
MPNVQKQVKEAPIGWHAIVDEVFDDEPPRVLKPIYKIFWGGSDVDPSLYDRPRSKKCSRSNLEGDLVEKEQMERYIAQGIPIIGICRGAQLLNVVNGGILVQHIEGHALNTQHPCTEVATGKQMLVSSTHHQMMIAHRTGQVLFVDYDEQHGVHWDNTDEPYHYNHVVEVVYYPETRCLCIQPHPEWMKQDSPFVKWINNFIKQEWDLDPIDFKEEERYKHY